MKALIAAMASHMALAAVDAEHIRIMSAPPEPGEGKKHRHRNTAAKTEPEIHHMTRQQRRAAERAAKKGTA